MSFATAPETVKGFAAGLLAKPIGIFLFLSLAASLIVLAVLVSNTPQYLRWRASKGSLRALLKLTAPLVRPDPVAKAEWHTLSEYSKRNVSWAMFALGTKLSSQGHSNFNYNQLVGYLWIKKAAEFNHPGAIDTLRRASIRDEPRYAPPSTGAGGGAIPVEKDHAIIHHPKAGHDPFKELAGLIGLTGIKTAVTNIAHRARLFEKRRSQGLSNSVPAMHLIFMGNPGTGKTIVARIIGGVLKQAGYLKKGHVVEVSVPELISQYVGETPLKVREKVTQAIDGVLFIDEAYGLMGHETSSGNSYGSQAITTLLKLMEDNREKLVVIAAGYPAEMQAFLDVNPGFRSRFTDVIHFEDYTPDELAAIFTKLVSDQQFSLYPSAAVYLGDVMKQARAEITHNFPNGRFVRNLFENSVKNLAARVGGMVKHSRQDLQVLKAEDIKLAFGEVMRNQRSDDPDEESDAEGVVKEQQTPQGGESAKAGQWDPPVLPLPLPLTAADPFAQLENMIGLVDIKQAVSDIGNRARLFGARQAQGLPAVRPVIHMALLGNPGTGKTTVARIMGEILHQTGYLTRGQVVEVLVSDLMGDNAGDTAQRVRQHVMRALDGVLLLDNAYKLSDEAGRATTTALVKLMEDYKDRLVVIAAGYEDEMQRFLDSDPGLRSRFTDVIRFADYTPVELLALYRQMATAQQYKITPAAEALLQEFFRNPPGVSTRSFSNGRLVRNIFEDSVKNLASRSGGKRMMPPSREDLETITQEDVQLACDEAQAQEERTAA